MGNQYVHLDGKMGGHGVFMQNLNSHQEPTANPLLFPPHFPVSGGAPSMFGPSRPQVGASLAGGGAWSRCPWASTRRRESAAPGRPARGAQRLAAGARSLPGGWTVKGRDPDWTWSAPAWWWPTERPSAPGLQAPCGRAGGLGEAQPLPSAPGSRASARAKRALLLRLR